MKKITVRDALRIAIIEEMLKDENVFIIGEEIGKYNGAYKVTKGILDQFGPNRVVDTPISEHGFTGLAIGAAMKGLRPIVEYMSFNFSMQAIDQIINSAAKTRYMSGGLINVPIVFRGPNASAKGVAAQHSQAYASWYSNVPGLKVVSPYYASDHRGLLKAAIRDNSPVIFLENEMCYGISHDISEDELNDPNYIVEISKGNVVREGTDITIVTFSLQVGSAVEAATILDEKHGISAEVIDLRTIRPIDSELIVESVKKN